MIDATLAAMGPSSVLDAARKELEEKKADLKKQITSSKPLHMQVESCRGAVERSQKRLEHAKQVLQDARQKVTECEAEVNEAETALAEKSGEMARLQAEMTKVHPPAQCGNNSLVTLRQSMESVITDMSQGAVQPAAIEETRNLMAQLFGGLQALANTSATAPQTVNQPSVLQMLQTVPTPTPQAMHQPSVLQMLQAVPTPVRAMPAETFQAATTSTIESADVAMTSNG